MTTKVELVTPDRVLFDGDGEFVVLRTDGGEIMFLPEHAPFIAAVDITVVRIAPPGTDADAAGPAGDEGGEFRAAAHGGFVHVVNNTITVLASVAEPAEEIDVDRARRALEEAKASGATGEGPEAAHPQTSSDGDEVIQSSAMLAMLNPDDPEVRLRRAEVRLQAAGVLESTGSASGSAH